LLVDPQTLETKVDEPGFYEIKPMSFAEAKVHFNNTPYIFALAAAAARSTALQNAGITTGTTKQNGISLTADLCPSHKPLDKRIFSEAIRAFQNAEQPVPIGLSLSGRWMHQHPQDLEWLKKMQAAQKINITWVNHSYNHRFNPKLPLQNNFLLEAGTNINAEILETEKAMLKNGLVPSVFFRLPGLVSNQQLVLTITGFGLITVGSDAWLAKGQKPRNGSILLVHANGNEPVGVNDFIKLLHSKAKAIAGKQWQLYDLKESMQLKFDGKGQ